MSTEKTNIEILRDIINEKMFDKDEAIEFLDSIQSEIEELNDEKDDLETELDSAKDKITDLENEEWEAEETIECGIGKIEYTADNLQLQELMEVLAVRIKETGSLKTLRMLQMPLPTA